jgi:hypothetical protein
MLHQKLYDPSVPIFGGSYNGVIASAAGIGACLKQKLSTFHVAILASKAQGAVLQDRVVGTVLLVNRGVYSAEL